MEYTREMARSSHSLYPTENMIDFNSLDNTVQRKVPCIISDDHTAYATLNLIGKHQIILHGKEEYVRDDATHINGIEGFWS